MRIFYFFILAFSVAFHILYKGDLSFVLLAFIIVLTLVSVIVLTITAFMTDVTADFEQHSAPRESPSLLRVTVKNRSIFPILCCSIDISYISHIPFDPAFKNKYRIAAPIGARKSETFVFNISANHCGITEIKLKRVLLSDYLRIATFPIRISKAWKSIALPVIYPVQATIENAPVSADESTAFSPHKPGDDPSEIYALREYREGDSNNRIHWKLSSRSENLIVKELSLPIGSRILIAVDFFSCSSASAIDRILDAAFSVSHFLIECDTVHTFSYARSNYNVNCVEIDSSAKHLLAVNEICSELDTMSTGFPFQKAAASDEFFISQKNFSKVIVIADSMDFARAEELAELFGEANITVICTGNPSQTKDENGKAEIIYADAEKLSSNEMLII